jgi:ubiquinone/menaquinone biosynthesis C-methylase UbiE
VVLGERENLPQRIGTIEAVLIANTFHELENPQTILGSIYQKLRPGGRLVILDRNPPDESALQRGGFKENEVGIAIVEQTVRSSGFHILGTTDPYVSPTGDSPWWLLIAQKPQ